jgi:hypothetical protein
MRRLLFKTSREILAITLTNPFRTGILKIYTIKVRVNVKGAAINTIKPRN